MVRLSIVQPLAFGPAQQRFGTIRVVEPERSPVIVFEVRFGKVAVQVRFADVVELPVHGALEQREERLDCVGVVEAARANVLVSRMVDGAVS